MRTKGGRCAPGGRNGAEACRYPLRKEAPVLRTGAFGCQILRGPTTTRNQLGKSRYEAECGLQDWGGFESRPVRHSILFGRVPFEAVAFGPPAKGTASKPATGQGGEVYMRRDAVRPYLQLQE